MWPSDHPRVDGQAARACFIAGRCYHYGVADCDKDWFQAAYFYLRAKASGHNDADIEICSMINLTGHEDAKDSTGGLSTLAANGYACALVSLGRLHLYSASKSSSYLAFEELRLAVESFYDAAESHVSDADDYITRTFDKAEECRAAMSQDEGEERAIEMYLWFLEIPAEHNDWKRCLKSAYVLTGRGQSEALKSFLSACEGEDLDKVAKWIYCQIADKTDDLSTHFFLNLMVPDSSMGYYPARQELVEKLSERPEYHYRRLDSLQQDYLLAKCHRLATGEFEIDTSREIGIVVEQVLGFDDYKFRELGEYLYLPLLTSGED